MDAVVDAATGQFELNEDQRAIQEMARSFAAGRVAPNALQWDKDRHFPDDVIRETGPLGFGGIYVRDDVGGSGLGRLDAVLIFEALAAADPAGSRRPAATATPVSRASVGSGPGAAPPRNRRALSRGRSDVRAAGVTRSWSPSADT